MNAPSVPLNDVLKTLDLATGSDEQLHAALVDAAARVAQEQGVPLDPARLATAAKVVQAQALVPVTPETTATSAEVPAWGQRPTSEGARQTILASLSQGLRGWLRRKEVTDQGAEVATPKMMRMAQVGFPLAVWASLLLIPEPWKGEVILAASLGYMGLIGGRLICAILGRQYRQLLPAVVDDSLRLRILQDPLVRHQVAHCLASDTPTLLQGDLDAITKHWNQRIAALQVDAQAQASVTQAQLRRQLQESTM